MTTPADRARVERAAQGLSTPAAPIGDDVYDARLAAAYRNTATVLASAPAVDSSAVRRGAVEPTASGAARRVRGEVARKGRSNKQKAADAATPTASRDASSPAQGEQETA